jgi:hypothetical protein
MLASGGGGDRFGQALSGTLKGIMLLLGLVGLSILILISAAVVIWITVVPACEPPALPTENTGRGETKELEEALSLHGLKLPADVWDISYTVRSGIDSHAVGLRLRTTPAGLNDLLTSLGSGQLNLQRGLNPWEDSSRLSSERPEQYDWDLATSELTLASRSSPTGRWGPTGW